MRLGACGVLAGILAGCTSNTIDAGTRDAGIAGVDAGGDADSGPTVIATSIQPIPTQLVSDGTSLFWTNTMAGVDGAISSMPVGGGTIQTVIPGAIASSGFPVRTIVATDEVSVYYLTYGGVYRAASDGDGSPALVSDDPDDAGFAVVGATALGERLYWVATGSGSPPAIVVKSAPLQGGLVSTIAEFLNQYGYGYDGIAVTVSTAPLSSSAQGGPVGGDWFPLASGVPDGGSPTQIPDRCDFVLSDTDAVYCESPSAGLFRVTSDGTTTMLGNVFRSASTYEAGNLDVAFDENYVYWVDSLPIGTVMRVAKGGGAPDIIARDTSPVAIAVDDGAVYWSDLGGNIMRLGK
jgi:hypothetical protein